MKKSKNIWVLVIFIALIALLILEEELFFEGTKKGINILAKTMIPSLFPFIVLSNIAYEMNAFSFLENIFGKIVKFLFHLPKNVSCILIFSAIGGYPTGAILAGKAYENKEISKRQLSAIMQFAMVGGPTFIIGGVGRQMFGSSQIGAILYLSVLISSLVTGLIFSFFLPFEEPKKEKSIHPKSAVDSFVKGTNTACESMIVICGFVLVFSAIVTFISSSPLEGIPYYLFTLPLEVTNSAMICSTSLGVEMAAVVLSFGGLAIHFQIFSILKGRINIAKFMFARFIAAGIAYLTSKILLQFWKIDTSAFSNIQKAVPKLSSITILPSILLVFLCFFMIVTSSRERSKIDFTANL